MAIFIRTSSSFTIGRDRHTPTHPHPHPHTDRHTHRHTPKHPNTHTHQQSAKMAIIFSNLRIPTQFLQKAVYRYKKKDFPGRYTSCHLLALTTGICINAHTHTHYTHTHTHTHIHKHTQTHTHIHTYSHQYHLIHQQHSQITVLLPIVNNHEQNVKTFFFHSFQYWMNE